MPSPPNFTNITPPRVALIDERTGLVSREWYRFFLNLFNLTGGGSNVTSITDLQVGPPVPTQEDVTDIINDVEAAKTQPTQESALDQIAELAKQVEALSVLPLTSWVLSELAELQTQIDGLLAASAPPVNFLTNGSSILYGNNLGGFSNVTIGSGVSFSGGTLSATGSGGTVTSVGATAPITSTGGTTPVIGVTAAALTEVDDTNVTLTLGGSPSTALLAATSLTLGWTGQLAVTRGGTGLATVAQGDLLYGSATNTLARLAKNTTATRYLANTGTSNNPAWAQIDLSNGVTGTLPTTNGGTGLTSYTADGVVYASSTSALATSSNLIFDGTNFVRGTSTAYATVTSGGAASTPALQNAATAQAGSSAGFFNWSTATSAAYLNFSKSKSGTIGSRAAVVDDDDVGSIVFAGDDGTNFASSSYVLAEVEGTVAAGSVPGRLIFATTAVGGTSPTQRVRINNAGYLQQLTAPIMPYQGAITSKAAAATLTGAELVTGILNTTGTTYTITLPTGTNIEGALAWAGNNVSLDWYVINTASGTITIGANGNTTLGALTIATGVSAQFRIRRTATNTFTVYRLG